MTPELPEVSCTKAKVQAFGGLLDDTVQSVHACGEDIEGLESFTYLGSIVHNNGRSDHEVIRQIGLAYIQCYGLTQREYMDLSVPMEEDKAPHLQVACAPCLTVWL